MLSGLRPTPIPSTPRETQESNTVRGLTRASGANILCPALKAADTRKDCVITGRNLWVGRSADSKNGLARFGKLRPSGQWSFDTRLKAWSWSYADHHIREAGAFAST
jgi:hypothetical protein